LNTPERNESSSRPWRRWPRHGCPSPAPTRRRWTARIVLLVDEWKALRNLPAVVAERLGYFRGDGMDVTVMNVRDDVWHGDMLMDGSIDAGMARLAQPVPAGDERDGANLEQPGTGVQPVDAQPSIHAVPPTERIPWTTCRLSTVSG
jgi:hypothetical protein